MSDNNHIIYTAEDIHRYFSGSMSAAEMYAMDKAALNDPLLAEAMEGYHSLPSFAKEASYADIQKQLDELKNKLPGKVVSINKRNNSWWKVAAAVLLIGGSVFAFLKNNSSKNKENAVVAKNDSLIKFHIASDSAAVAINNSSSEKVVTSDSLNANAIASPSKGNKKAVTYIGSTTLASSSNVTTYQLADSTNMDLAKAENNGLINSSSVFKKEVTKSVANIGNSEYYTTIDDDEKAKKSVGKLKRASQQPAAANFTGRIVDDNNNAVPYAKLMINNKKQAKTDINGYFNMALPDTSIRLDVAAYNYYPQTTNVSANNFAGIILKAKRSTFKKNRSVADSIALRSKVDILYKLGAEPKDGWIAYQQFLIQQCSNSEYDNGKPVTGETIVQFEIDANGLPTNFHFEKSINEEVNDGVENLIINGPEWKYTEHNAIPGIVRIKITF